MRSIGLGLFVLMALASASPVQAQDDLISLYQSARLQEQARRFMEQGPVATRPPTSLQASSDSLRQRIRGRPDDSAAPASQRPTLNVTRWRSVGKLERGWFRNKFRQAASWAYAGNSAFRPLDTLQTRALRARLQDRFGDPTQALGDFGPQEVHNQGEYIQFEYWFVLNDSIPLVAMDVNGPFERGLVLSTKRRYQEHLPALRDALEQELMQSATPAAHVDYYYDPETGTWYRAGFDGTRYFLKSIRTPNLHLGRPWLERSQP